MKMLILRGKAGYYDDTDWPDGALHEQPALDYATRRGYDGTVGRRTTHGSADR